MEELAPVPPAPPLRQVRGGGEGHYSRHYITCFGYFVPTINILSSLLIIKLF